MSPSLLAGALDAARRRQPPFALNYHGIGPPVPGDWAGLMIPLATFEQHVATIRARGRRVVGVTELWRRVKDGDAVGHGAVTFDDGLADTLARVVAPLADNGLTGTAFIPTGLMGRPHPHLPAARIVDRAQLLEVAAAGLEIGAHSVHHHDLSRLRYAEALEELRRSKEDLEDMLGREVTSMAYPFGRFTRETKQAAEAAGYACACSDVGGGAWEAYALPRETILPSTTAVRLRLKLLGLYSPVHRVAVARNALRRRTA